MEKWSGKLAVVTGASSGIGAQIVRDLAKSDINVIALARRVEKLEALKKELSSAPGKVTVMACDVSSKTSVDSVFAEIEKVYGVLNILVNNAGISRLVVVMKIGHKFLSNCYLKKCEHTRGRKR